MQECNNAYESSLRLLKSQIASGKVTLATQVKVMAINGRFSGYCLASESKSGILTTAGELLTKLHNVYGKTKGEG